MASDSWRGKCVTGVAVILALGGVHPAAQGPQLTLPFEDIGACPFEGCVYRDWTATDAVLIRETREPGAAIVFTLGKGEHIQAVTGVVITSKPGIGRVLKPLSLRNGAASAFVDTNETLAILTSQGEGFWTAWYRGHFYDVEESTDFTFTEKPTSVWWVLLRGPDGSGWTNEAPKFTGADQLAYQFGR